MALKPWYKVVTPREDLREGRPLDASEFAVHLDKVRTGEAPADYRDPKRFFDRTYLTGNLAGLAAEVLRRLSGETTETSAIFNMMTQFGGGKTHALTLLYHLAAQGSRADGLRDVATILKQAGIKSVPANCAVAAFVGTEFDSLRGRGGDDGTPLRRTPWGEIAWQLGGQDSYNIVARHDEEFTEPKGDVIRAFLPKDRACLILMDEIINYVSTYRNKGWHNRLYNFIQSLSETIRGVKGAVLVASIPASELSYTDKDEADQQRFKNILDRLGKAVMITVGTETAEIVRRRLFEWDPAAVGSGGRVILSKDAAETCKAYAEWCRAHKDQLPNLLNFDRAAEQFQECYPFHPVVLSVFERKWQTLPRFQQTRGILRLLALWVARAYQDGFKGAHKDFLITLGTAPWEESTFLAAVCEQLGQEKLKGVVTTDIAGKKDSHAIRLDEEAEESLRKARVHRKAATSIFLESNGGQAKAEATIPEVRLAIGEPGLEIGNVETAIEALSDACYYLTAENNRYRFSLKENLNKRFADRKASIKKDDIAARVNEEVKKVFAPAEGVERIFFPEKSIQVPDRAALTFVIVGPERGAQDDPEMVRQIESMTREYGKSARTYKSALVWVAPENGALLRDEARKLLAWKDIDSEGLALDEAQSRQLRENIAKAERDLKEAVWRSYKEVILLGKDNGLQRIDLGLLHSSSAATLTGLILGQLRQADIVVKDVTPRFLMKNWPPAFTEWNTKSVRDAFFASPQFPRLLGGETIKDTVARGVSDGLIAYVGKGAKGKYQPFVYKKTMTAMEVEISDDVFIITAETAEKHKEPALLTRLLVVPGDVQLKPGERQAFVVRGYDQFQREMLPDGVEWSSSGGKIDMKGLFVADRAEGNYLVIAKVAGTSATANVRVAAKVEPPPPPLPKGTKFTWTGEVPPQKWTTFYTKALTKLVPGGGLKLTVKIEAEPAGGVSEQQKEEIKAALRDLGLKDEE